MTEITSRLDISLPGTAPGHINIRVWPDGRTSTTSVIAGSATRHGKAWRYTLYSAPGKPAAGDETDITANLKSLRRALTDRITQHGPWWKDSGDEQAD